MWSSRRTGVSQVYLGVQIILVIFPLANSHLEVDCFNGSDVYITARYHGDATDFFSLIGNTSGCHGYRQDAHVWILENLSRDVCGGQVEGGVWTGRLGILTGPGTDHITYHYHCPIQPPAARLLQAMEPVHHHTTPPVGHIQLQVVDTRGQQVHILLPGRLVRLQAVLTPGAMQDWGLVTLNCRAGDRFPDPNIIKDILVNGCGDGRVLAWSRGFVRTTNMADKPRGPKVTTLSAPFRAFRLSQNDVIQFSCSFVVCHEHTWCRKKSCRVHSRPRRQLPPHVVTATSEPVPVRSGPVDTSATYDQDGETFVSESISSFLESQNCMIMFEEKEDQYYLAPDEDQKEPKEVVIKNKNTRKDTKLGTSTEPNTEQEEPDLDEVNEIVYGPEFGMPISDMTYLLSVALCVVTVLIISLIACVVGLVFRINGNKRRVILVPSPGMSASSPGTLAESWQQQQAHSIDQGSAPPEQMWISERMKEEENNLLDVSNSGSLFIMTSPGPAGHSVLHVQPQVRIASSPVTSGNGVWDEQPYNDNVDDLVGHPPNGNGGEQHDPVGLHSDMLPQNDPLPPADSDLPLLSHQSHTANIPSISALERCIAARVNTRTERTVSEKSCAVVPLSRRDLIDPIASRLQWIRRRTRLSSDTDSALLSRSPGDTTFGGSPDMGDVECQVLAVDRSVASTPILNITSTPILHYDTTLTTTVGSGGTPPFMEESRAIHRSDDGYRCHPSGLNQISGPLHSPTQDVCTKTYVVPLGRHSPLYNMPVISDRRVSYDRIPNPATPPIPVPEPQDPSPPRPAASPTSPPSPSEDLGFSPPCLRGNPATPAKKGRRPPIPECFIQQTDIHHSNNWLLQEDMRGETSSPPQNDHPPPGNRRNKTRSRVDSGCLPLIFVTQPNDQQKGISRDENNNSGDGSINDPAYCSRLVDAAFLY